MKLKLVAALAIPVATPALALASPSYTKESKSKWMPENVIKAKIDTMGCKVKTLTLLAPANWLRRAHSRRARRLDFRIVRRCLRKPFPARGGQFSGFLAPDHKASKTSYARWRTRF